MLDTQHPEGLEKIRYLEALRPQGGDDDDRQHQVAIPRSLTNRPAAPSESPPVDRNVRIGPVRSVPRPLFPAAREQNVLSRVSQHGLWSAKKDSAGTADCACPKPTRPSAPVRPGFTGALCENKINQCAPVSPCLNGDTFTEMINNFKCTCPPGNNLLPFWSASLYSI